MNKNSTPESPFERCPVTIHDSAEEGALQVAAEIAELIRERSGRRERTVLGLATGSTPVPVYRELVRMHREEGLSFADVVTFNLDEYYPLPRSHRESYWQFMQDQFFRHIDIDPANTHVPDGEVGREEAFAHCREYDAAIDAAGGIDLQILGIGRTGHIGFNEPGSGAESPTRLVTLNEVTRQDAARDFLGEENVPRYAITMGVGTILRARRIRLMAWGRSKASVIAKAVEEPPSDRLPASYLQGHDGVEFILDRPAAGALTRIVEPWRVDFVDWNPELIRRAVIGLCRKVEKPVLKLVDRDYNEQGLADLLTVKGSAYQLNIHIFNVLQHTITGWPGGKPDADDSHRPERADPARKRSLVLASEPQEDILGMGGTIRRLCEQGHDVTLAYATSGDLAVPDREALASLELTHELCPGATLMNGGVPLAELIRALREKDTLDEDGEALRAVKGAIREGEARQSMRMLGIHPDRLEFMRLPFYGRGRYRQFVATEEDRTAMVELLERIRPHQVFLSGDQADPASVTGMTFRVFRDAFRRCREEEQWPSDTYIWVYRGPTEEWGLDQIDMAVPLSPDELQRKLDAAFQHRSQHSQTSFALSEQSESWQRTESLNRKIAREYDALGMAEYEAIECFLRWEG